MLVINGRNLLCLKRSKEAREDDESLLIERGVAWIRGRTSIRNRNEGERKRVSNVDHIQTVESMISCSCQLMDMQMDGSFELQVEERVAIEMLGIRIEWTNENQQSNSLILLLLLVRAGWTGLGSWQGHGGEGSWSFSRLFVYLYFIQPCLIIDFDLTLNDALSMCNNRGRIGACIDSRLAGIKCHNVYLYRCLQLSPLLPRYHRIILESYHDFLLTLST